MRAPSSSASAARSRTISRCGATRVPAQAIADGHLRRRDRPGRGRRRGKTDGRLARTRGRRGSTRPSCGPEAGVRAGGHDHGGQRLEHQRRRGGPARRRRRCERWACKAMAGSSGPRRTASEPEWFTTAPVDAIRKLLDRVGWRVDEVDLFEINEAFAVVAMVAGASWRSPPRSSTSTAAPWRWGTRSVAAGRGSWSRSCMRLKRTGGRRGVASLCIGGGEAVAVAVEATGL